MKWWLRFGCSLTGWNANMLAQCSEASKSQLSKYTSALLILMIVWSITGFLFAQRYVGLPVWGCLLVSLVFVTIVVMIERQIILAINPTKKLAVFRLFIAIIMAIVGSTEFDSVIGLDRLKAIHLNDSMNGLGSHKDRHAKIGEGEIGLEALVRVIRHPATKGIPFILETSNNQGWAREIALLRKEYEEK